MKSFAVATVGSIGAASTAVTAILTGPGQAGIVAVVTFLGLVATSAQEG